LYLFSFATPAGSIVYVSEADVGRTFYTSEPGFVIKKLVYKLGDLTLAGGGGYTANQRLKLSGD
jgi:hypothetical protein